LKKRGKGRFKQAWDQRGIYILLKYNPQLKTKARVLRTALTDAEQWLWNRLRLKQILGVQFYRQKPSGNYIVDFYAPAARLVVEVDGAHHTELSQTKYDERRSEYLQEQNLRVLRFDDRQVLLETDAVVEEIYRAVDEGLIR
jgi:very-short-patch-repair endonuclease